MLSKAIEFLILGLLRAFDLITDIAYLKLSNFYNIYLYYGSIACLFAPSIIITISNFLTCCYSVRKLSDFCSQLLYYFFILFCYPSGLSGVFYFFVLICYTAPSKDTKDIEAIKKHKEKMHSIKYIDKICKISELIFKCIPQMMIQIYNNEYANAWTAIAYLSIVASILSSLSTFFSFCSMIDKEIKYENEDITALKIQPMKQVSNGQEEFYQSGFVDDYV
ncbi:hypothetical protein SteCoe_30326 [Stentor coeruleus]|uniref:XK-related protein n=1 Tax=Stentor coeruleus TaxID=5963 RepID=A0A1R2B4C5_9CILI|nr:hypothetical protein SteCoe_30326 [Stentor coeruleus]